MTQGFAKNPSPTDPDSPEDTSVLPALPMAMGRMETADNPHRPAKGRFEPERGAMR